MSVASAKAPVYRSDSRLDPACQAAADAYLAASRALRDRSWWGLRMTTALLSSIGTWMRLKARKIRGRSSSRCLPGPRSPQDGSNNQCRQRPFPPTDTAALGLGGFDRAFPGCSATCGSVSDDIISISLPIYQGTAGATVSTRSLCSRQDRRRCRCGSEKFRRRHRASGRAMIGLDIGEKVLNSPATGAEGSLRRPLDYRLGSLLDMRADAPSTWCGRTLIIHTGL